MANVSGLSAIFPNPFSLLTVSTYDTDYPFVKSESWEKALAALRGAGCRIGEAP